MFELICARNKKRCFYVAINISDGQQDGTKTDVKVHRPSQILHKAAIQMHTQARVLVSLQNNLLKKKMDLKC